MTTWHTRLVDLNACKPARDWCADYPATRAGFRVAWQECPDAPWMLWLAVRVLPRRRAVGVLVEVIRATCAHLTDDDVTIEVLNPLASWAAGDDTIDVSKVRERAWELWGASVRAAYAATWRAAALAAAADATALVAADAAADAATARAYAADADADDVTCAQTHVVLAHLDADEVWGALMGEVTR